MLWIKTFHILFVMAWLVGMFYLPRILVHYVEGRNANEDVRRLITMAEKLLKFSTLMAIPALGLGIWLWLAYNFSGSWLWIKLALVGLLIFYHGLCARYIQKMKNDLPLPGSVFFRFFNEATLIMVVPILIMVVVKPFS